MTRAPRGAAVPPPGIDDTIRLRPAAALRRPIATRAAAATIAVAAAVALAAVLAWLFWPYPAPRRPAIVAPPPPAVAPAPVVPAPVAPAPPPAFAIQTGNEAEIRAHAATTLTVFRFAADPNIVVLDFPSLLQQGLMLDRVAALEEKAGLPRDRVLTDAELDAAIRARGDTIATFYYGHDYPASALARFFALAAQDHVPLNPEEERLRALLAQLGWLAPGVHAGLISVSRAGADANLTMGARAAILRHELAHGEFFSDPAYADYTRRFWTTMLTESERAGFRRFLHSQEYDTDDEELMLNEMQAYLMFTRDPHFFKPEDAGLTEQRLAELQAEFMRGLEVGWLRNEMEHPLTAAP